MQKVIRQLALPIAFILGYFFPEGHIFTPLIPWFVRFMIFMIFLQCRLDHIRFYRGHLVIVLLNLLIPILFWQIFLWYGSPVYGKIAFFTAIAPTGTAATAVMGFLHGNIEFVFTSFVINTLTISCLMPFLLPWVLHDPTPGVILHIAAQMGSVVLLPILLAGLVRWQFPSSINWARRCQTLIFLAWVFCITIICSNASYFIITNSDLSFSIVLRVGLIAGIVCFFNFFIGYCFGERKFKHESSQALGQKNTSIAIFLALLYADPLVALGPTLYTFWHNLWNFWQLQDVGRRKGQKKELEDLKNTKSGD